MSGSIRWRRSSGRVRNAWCSGLRISGQEKGYHLGHEVSAESRTSCSQAVHVVSLHQSPDHLVERRVFQGRTKCNGEPVKIGQKSKKPTLRYKEDLFISSPVILTGVGAAGGGGGGGKTVIMTSPPLGTSRSAEGFRMCPW